MDTDIITNVDTNILMQIYIWIGRFIETNIQVYLQKIQMYLYIDLYIYIDTDTNTSIDWNIVIQIHIHW